MPSKTLETIALENLRIDLRNPRYDPRASQRDALARIAQDQDMKLVNLAEDIIERGLNPSELPIVARTDEEGIFTVLEGNRRIAALKIVWLPSLLASLGLPQRLVKRYKALHHRANDTLPRELDCAVVSHEDAKYWILLKHTGENEGIGVVSWDGRARQRFRGSSPALQAIDLVHTRGYLDEETNKKLPKIAITNIERILNTPDARKELGVDVKNDKLILKASNEEEALGRLAIVVSEVAHKHIRVTDLDTKDQRVNYAKAVASIPLPKPQTGTASKQTTGRSTTATTPVSGPGRRTPPERSTLIPKRFKVAIPQIRINRIYHELQKLNLEKFINSSAVLFRVFVELSIDDFAQRNKISLKTATKAKPKAGPPPRPRDMTLRQKIKTVAAHLETNSICSKEELHGIRALISNRDHVLSVDSLNAYVHNRNYNPTPSDLKGNWDNVQLFIERMWISYASSYATTGP